MTDHNDQFHMGRLPLKPYAFINAKTAVESDTGDGLSSQDELAVCKEFLIDYLSTEDHKATYDMYIVDPNDRTHFINLSQLIRTMAPLGDANKLTITIEGKEDAVSLKDIINYIYSRFIFPDTETENYEDILDKIFNSDPSPINPLLTDVNGDVILPITIANNVYDKNGVSLQTKLDSITRVGFASTFIVAEERGRSFEFSYPFEDYREGGNYVEVRIGGTIINKSRYHIVDSEKTDDGLTPREATIVFNDHDIEKGRTISLLFIYNAAADGSTYHIMSGANIAAHSLPSTALEKMSDSFCYADPTSVASSKALYDLYVTLSEVIANSNNYSTFAVERSTLATEIAITTNANFVLSEGSSITILFNTEKKNTAGYSFKVNNQLYELYYGGEVFNKTIPANTMLKLYYYDNRFYIKSFNDYKISTNRFFYTTKDKETEISYNGLAINDLESEIFVYRNGVRLFEGIDYKLDRTNSKITLFVMTESQEKIVFETLEVIDY